MDNIYDDELFAGFIARGELHGVEYPLNVENVNTGCLKLIELT